MEFLTSLWLPILLSAVFAFLASWILHVLLFKVWHAGDMAEMPGEGAVMEAMRKAGVKPGDYFFPYCTSQQELAKPEVKQKWETGPVGKLTVHPNGLPQMGKTLAQWFVFLLVIGVLVAYVARLALGDGADYLQVFRITSVVAWLGYAGAEPVASIWWGRKWSTTIKNLIDGLIYALLTGGTFGWLWP